MMEIETDYLGRWSDHQPRDLFFGDLLVTIISKDFTETLNVEGVQTPHLREEEDPVFSTKEESTEDTSAYNY